MGSLERICFFFSFFLNIDLIPGRKNLSVMVRQGYSQFPLSNVIYGKAVFTTRNGILHCKNALLSLPGNRYIFLN